MTQAEYPEDGRLLVNGEWRDAVFFHRPKEPHGWLSNWHRSPFTLDGIAFSSSEQYFIYRKCRMFGDAASAQAILDTDDPAAQQRIGRQASGFQPLVWDGVKQLYMFRALLAKFTQNEDLKRRLLDTGDAYLVECAFTDRIWACGVRLTDPRRLDISRWRGQNLLGFALMETREAIRRMEENGA